jgi:hypothetical protein
LDEPVLPVPPVLPVVPAVALRGINIEIAVVKGNFAGSVIAGNRFAWSLGIKAQRDEGTAVFDIPRI